MKLDFYISKNNSAIHLGTAHVYLREIIDREAIDTGFKTSVIQKTVRIMPAGKGNSDQPIGSLRFKMRIRKPISEAIRFYREKNEISHMGATTYQMGERGSRKIVTIQIVGCKDLKVKYGEIAKIAPFFFY